MCGLAGFIGDPAVSDTARLKRARVLEGLFVANVSRGDDASGVATIAHSGGCVIYKRAVDAYRLIDLPAFTRIIRARGLDAIIAHTRLGTHGENIDRNAHPFRERTIIGAHNGIISNHGLLGAAVEQDAWQKAAKVDSQQVFRVMASAHKRSGSAGYGAEYARLLPLVEGSMALTWVDTRDPGSVYLFRHDNPLSVAVVPSAHTAYWSSQDDHLGAALQTAYGADWYLMVIKPDTVYRLRWAKDDLMYQTWAVDMPIQPRYVYGMYEDTHLIGENSDLILSDDICDICGLDIGSSLTVIDEIKMCRRCATWWTEHGQTVYGTVDEMKAIADTAGIGASNVIESNRRVARKELS